MTWRIDHASHCCPPKVSPELIQQFVQEKQQEQGNGKKKTITDHCNSFVKIHAGRYTVNYKTFWKYWNDEITTEARQCLPGREISGSAGEGCNPGPSTRTLGAGENSRPKPDLETLPSQNNRGELGFSRTQSYEQRVPERTICSSVEGGNPSRSTRSLEAAESSWPEPDLETSPSQNPHVELQNLLAQIFPSVDLHRVENLEAWLLQTHFDGCPVLNYCETRGRET
eukprot:CAMPEP_0184740778 /NCGR_PEP_ID=MMETSP0315-20130426/3799_1 /TAXON_ID=101924 /ORGANISM="Rhodosorus marinus, Strain UTEX LB 2760" /LENGTH=225 /DNA_ID=CAMNT_0027210671 /DNA_START=231 /DNA_END=904 /DNA_ORIENTATION=+